MPFSREPRIHSVAIKDLRPTQLTVGMREVKTRRKIWRKRSSEQLAEQLGAHMIPVVLGPRGAPYVIDHHHLTLAMHQEGIESVATTVVADLRRLPLDAFWLHLDNRGWMHPFDTRGRRRPYDALPRHIWDLVDDPYRSLAGELRRGGGFAKDTTPFSEFLWADHLRRNIEAKLLRKNFRRALTLALELAKSTDADFLPGWCGPTV
jgi:hypothetical protein